MSTYFFRTGKILLCQVIELGVKKKSPIPEQTLVVDYSASGVNSSLSPDFRLVK